MEVKDVLMLKEPIPVAVPSKTQVCSRLIAEIARSNPAEGMDVLLHLLWFAYVVHSATGLSLVQWRRTGYVCVCVQLCVV